MLNKVLRIGDSIGITLPKQTLKEMGVSIGDKVVVTFLDKKKSLVIKPYKSQQKPISDRIAKLTVEFVDKYRPALKKLA